MTESRTTPQTAAEPSIGALVGKLSENFSRLIRNEIQLLQAQVAEKGKTVGVGAGLLAGAAVFGLFGLGWLLTAAMLALAAVLPYWAASLIVAGAVLLVAAILGLAGKAMLNRSPTPQPQENIKLDVEAVKRGVGK